MSRGQDSASVATSTSGFAVKATTAADVLTGSMIPTNMSAAGTRWVQQHGMYRNGASAVSGGGSKTLFDHDRPCSHHPHRNRHFRRWRNHNQVSLMTITTINVQTRQVEVLNEVAPSFPDLSGRSRR